MRWVSDEAYQKFKHTYPIVHADKNPQKRDTAQKRLRNRLQHPAGIHRRDPTVEQEEKALPPGIFLRPWYNVPWEKRVRVDGLGGLRRSVRVVT